MKYYINFKSATIAGLFATTFLSIFTMDLNAHAAKQYRCSGLIQYRPCNDDRSIPALAKDNENNQKVFQGYAARAKLNDHFTDASVYSTKYNYDKKKNEGVWSGFVRGDGPVVLKLKLQVPGSPAETRYMGKAILRGKSSPFEFRSTPPKVSGWTWLIMAKGD